jgi:hypothetical protein
MVGLKIMRATSATATGASSIGNRKATRNSRSPGTCALRASAIENPIAYCNPTDTKAISVVVRIAFQKRGSCSSEA